MLIIANFLPPNQFKHIQSVLMGDKFPWFYNDHTCYPGDGLSYLSHVFINMEPPWDGEKSTHYSLWDDCLERMQCHQVYRIKSNLNLRTIFNRSSGWHYDFNDMMTAVLYINTCNGYTKVKGHGKVKSVANRLLRFSSNIQHAGFTCTDEQSRVVVNFNYKPLSL